MSDGKETYLGDGLYASYDGFFIKLRAPRMNGDHEVLLEPQVFGALLQFVMQSKPLGDAIRMLLDSQTLASKPPSDARPSPLQGLE